MGKRDLLMLKSDSIFSSTYNKIIALKYCLNRRARKKLKKNLSLRSESARKSRTCFVIGNGPSANIKTLKKIKAYPMLTVNFFHKGTEDLHSDYHVMIDPCFYLRTEDKKYTERIIERETNTKFILTMEIAQALYGKSDYPDNVYCINSNAVQHGNMLGIDMCRPMTSCPNVIPSAIQCAIYMGYQEIYLLGCEFGLYGNAGIIGGHFYEKRESRKPHEHDSPDSLIQCGLVHMHHEAIINYCNRHGITIKNLSPSTNLGEYDLDELDHVLEIMQ